MQQGEMLKYLHALFFVSLQKFGRLQKYQSIYLGCDSKASTSCTEWLWHAKWSELCPDVSTRL